MVRNYLLSFPSKKTTAGHYWSVSKKGCAWIEKLRVPLTNKVNSVLVLQAGKNYDKEGVSLLTVISCFKVIERISQQTLRPI
jgi:hypothetical protein